MPIRDVETKELFEAYHINSLLNKLRVPHMCGGDHTRAVESVVHRQSSVKAAVRLRCSSQTPLNSTPGLGLDSVLKKLTGPLEGTVRQGSANDRESPSRDH
jgi:hypothetical protein